MKLIALTLDDALAALEWRNERLDALRTPYQLTEQEQARWYENREGRWWGIVDDYLIGYGGIQHIQWESRIGELSLLMDPEYADLRREALGAILSEAFRNMNLKTVYAEVYECNKDLDWWKAEGWRRSADVARLPRRKYHNGEYWGSAYMSFEETVCVSS